ncbi:monocarboxylate transporter 11-like [Dermacentor andersoni]|uniref:monocarboxylate transporter 11-like n=1 Tax=Dermacentor andersoni TaxID=34620 RepID=UPI003B3A6357
MGTKTVGSMASASSTASKPVASVARNGGSPAECTLADEIKVETESDGEGTNGRRECATPEGDGKSQRRQQHARTDSFGRPERPSSRSDPPRQLSSAEQRIAATIRQHYYPEGGWGWVVCVCVCLVNALSWGMQLNYGVMHAAAVQQFGEEHAGEAPWLGSASLASSMFVSPVVVAWCRRKSVRLTAVLGGLVAALGCLFSSFASQLHQGLFSQGLVLGLGLGMARDAGGLVLGQYFKRRRHCAEVVACAGSGLGTAAMAAFFHSVLGSLGWRHGLQAATGLVSLNFVIGAFYRSASLYHPQRRAIVHLKNQRRKIKEKRPRTEKPPFFDFAALRTRTLRVVMVAAALAAAGLYTPFFCLVPLSAAEGVQGAWALQALLGLATAGGTGVAGLLLLRRPTQCVLSRRCLCQLSLLGAGLAMLALGALNGFAGYALFAAVYGASAGGVAYALRMLVFERLRARHFGRAWGFVQWAQCLPVLVGVPVTGYISKSREDPKAGFYFSAACTFAGATSLFFLPEAARVESLLCHHVTQHQQRQRQDSNHSHDTSCCGEHQCVQPARHCHHHHPSVGDESPNKGSFEGPSPTEAGDVAVANNYTPCTCRRSLLCYQRTMSWTTSVDLLDQPALAGLTLDAECVEDEGAEVGVRPQFSERVVDDRIVAEVGGCAACGAATAGPLCECAHTRDRAVVVSPKKMHVARCSHEPLIFRSTMAPIEEVTSTV